MLKQLYRFLSPRYQNLFLEYKVKLKPRYGHGLPAHPELYKIIDANRETYIKLLKKALANKKNIWAIRDSKVETDNNKPAWNNGYLPGLDIIGIYTMLARFKPKRYIEIGSGNSTRVAHKAFIEKDLSTEFISIDPKPRAEIDQIPNRMIREPFENVNLDIVAELNANDILFLDNSHRILPNSDSMVFFMEILPRLKRGVIVHLHDIYLPYDYPQFMCDRFYSEQYALAIYLLANPDKYETILPNYFISEDKELSELIAPIWDHENLKDVERHGGSYWIRIKH
ncbi:MAG: class I SAM-dependent methyltransferase [Bacteroidetes bacterium]|nr:MAG: class I SAM-dependent methyltransferase [Bacteroidota bacterium]